MFQEYEIPDRFPAARDCGFIAVEFLSPYAFSVDEVRQMLLDAGLNLILLNISPGEEGEVGTAALPGREAFFQNSFQQALTYATGLGAPMIHVLAGKNAGQARTSEALFIDNIRWAADLALEHQINILLEPLNTQDVSGYLHSLSDQTAELIEKINRSNVKMQFDFYHLQIMEGNLAAGLSRHFDKLGHVQFSSVPGRHEPQFGEVNVHHLFQHLDEIGYTGWIGCEYWAKHGTVTGLTWGAAYGIGGSEPLGKL